MTLGEIFDSLYECYIAKEIYVNNTIRLGDSISFDLHLKEIPDGMNFSSTEVVDIKRDVYLPLQLPDFQSLQLFRPSTYGIALTITHYQVMPKIRFDRHTILVKGRLKNFPVK